MRAAIAGVAAILWTATAAMGSEPLIVAGLTLDQPFTMSRCPQGRGTKMEKRTAPCWVAFLRDDDKRKDPESRQIQWPGKNNAGPFGYKTIVMVKDQILVTISFKTTGYKFQDIDLRQLIEKFGTPTALNTIKMENMFGAQFDKVEAMRNTEYYVDFEGFLDKLDEGRVFVQSAARRKQDVEEVKRYNAAHPRKPGL